MYACKLVGCTPRENGNLQSELRAGMQEAKRVEEQFEARLAAQRELHSTEVAALRNQLAEARTQAAGSAERARAVGEDVAALKAALAIVQEEQRVQPPLSVVCACPVDEMTRCPHEQDSVRHVCLPWQMERWHCKHAAKHHCVSCSAHASMNCRLAE